MIRFSSALLIAGLCVASVASASDDSSMDRIDRNDQVQSDSDVSQGARVAGDSSRVESQTQLQGEQVAQSQVQENTRVVDDADKADRSGPVPFADLGRVGGDNQTLKTEKAINQDQQLLARGEIIDRDLVIHLPAGTLHDTLSLRSGTGLNLGRNELQRIARFDGNDLRLSLQDLRDRGSDDVSDLWVWGTGPESSSLLQRVAVNGTIPATQTADNRQERQDVSDVQDIPQRRSAGIGNTLGAPVQRRNDDQIQKENDMLRDADMEKSTSNDQTGF